MDLVSWSMMGATIVTSSTSAQTLKTLYLQARLHVHTTKVCYVYSSSRFVVLCYQNRTKQVLILSSLGTLLTSLQGWALLKIPTKGKMTSQNIKDTCEGLGYSPTCHRNDDHTYNDDKCVKPLKGDQVYQLRAISAAVCPENENPTYWWKCKPMDGMCEYMVNYGSGSTHCQNEAGSMTSSGNMENKWSSCAFKL